MSDDEPECENCGDPASPGGNADLCPACEDLENWRGDWARMAQTTAYRGASRPPHGNTTR